MYPEFKKFSLLNDSAQVITSYDVDYYHVAEKWKCLDCKYAADDTTFVRRTHIVSQTENTCTMTGTIHCPQCDGQNISMPDKPQFGIQHD